MSARKKEVKADAGAAVRADGWSNIWTGLGTEKDSTLYTEPGVSFLKQGTLDALYQDDIAAKIVNKPVQEMLRAGFKINIPDDDGAQGDWIYSEMMRLRALDLVKQLMMEGRLYGGACLFFGVNNAPLGDNPVTAKPFPESGINSLDYLFVLNRYQLSSSSNLVRQYSSPQFLMPEAYELNIDNVKSKYRFHHSWLYRFDGVPLPFSLRQKNAQWGDSVLNRPYRILQAFNAGHGSIGPLMKELSVAVFKLKGLITQVAQGNEAQVIKRLQLILKTMSVFNGIVIQDDEDYDRKGVSVAGIQELIGVLNKRLCAATDIPHTILFNEGPGGSLGGTGDSEKRDWYDYVAAQQSTELAPILMYIIRRICMQKGGATKGIMPPGLSLEFFSLWHQTEKEILELRKIQADIDNIYTGNGTYDPEDVAQSRFGSGEYSYDTKINFTGRKAFEDKESKAGETDPAAEDKAA